MLRILLLLLIIANVHGFYVPGVTPVEFHTGDVVEVKAVKMTSTKTQLPFEYYSLPFCKPRGDIKYSPENLGEVLRGDRIVNTPYVVQTAIHKQCTALCEQITISKEDSAKFYNRIKNGYSVHLLVDNLPAATKFHIDDGKQIHYEHGYRLGFMKNNRAYLNNHLRLIIKHNSDDNFSKVYRIVGFEVEAASVALSALTVTSQRTCMVINSHGKNAQGTRTLSLSNMQEIHPNQEAVIQFSYEVVWENSEIHWASRWDTYLTMTDGQIHWFSITNSVVIIFFLSGILTMIMIRTLRKDIAKYNRDDDVEETMEESGWKLVHGDVFRPPRYPRLLAALIGSGVQISCMVFIVIFFAMLGMLSPASRGALMSAAIFTYAFMGVFAGFFAGRLYKTMRGQLWKSTALYTSILFPTIVLGIGFLLNFFIWGKQSSAAVPFGTMVAILCLWLGISLPLVFVGYFFGYRKRTYDHPVRTNQIPRAVPEQKWYHNMFVSILVAGMLPFGAVFIELFFVFTAIWERQFYYLFGFLFIVFIILIISTSQIAVVMVYFQLCGEDYHWWWRSYIVSGGSALYVFGYTIFYFVTKLEITAVIPTFIYFGYSLMMVITFWMLTGTIGFYAAYWFVRKIYSAIKID